MRRHNRIGGSAMRSASPRMGSARGGGAPAFDQSLSFAGNGNRVSHTVSTPFLGMSAGDGVDFWMMVEWFYSGSGLEGEAALVSVGNAATTIQNANIGCSGFGWRGGGAQAYANPGVVAGSKWYLNTARFRNVGATHRTTAFQDGVTVAEVSSAGAVGNTSYNELRIGEIVSSSISTTTNFDGLIGYVAFGRGNPAAAHEWAYNDGELRRVDGYDFGADPYGATLDGFILLARVSPGNTTFDVAEVVDSVGAFDSWTLTGTLAFSDRAPGFVNPAGDPPATPSRYIYPRYATTDDANLTLCINTKKIGEAVAGDFTVTALTHSVAGDISGTVSGTTFPNPGAGTITGTISGVSVAVEIITPLALPADPQFYTLYDGNALVAGIEP